MKKILSSLISVKELYLITDVILKLGKVILDRYQLLQLVRNRISSNLPILDKSINYDASSAYTEKLKELDDHRDQLYGGLYHYLTSLLRLGTAEQKEAAQGLLRIYDIFGLEMRDESYTDESISMRNFLNMLAEPANSDALNKVNAQIFVQNLQNAETAFEATMDERNKNENDEASHQKVKEARAKLVDDCNYVLSSIDLILEQAPDAEIENAAKAINEYVSDVLAKARARKTRKENNKDETEFPD